VCTERPAVGSSDWLGQNQAQHVKRERYGEMIARTVFTCSHRFQISIASAGGAEALQVIRELLIGTLIAMVKPNTRRRQTARLRTLAKLTQLSMITSRR